MALTCPYCYRSTFKQTSDLRRHIRIHTGEKPFRCQHCPYSAVRREHLNDHLWRRHKIVAKKRTQTDLHITLWQSCTNSLYLYWKLWKRYNFDSTEDGSSFMRLISVEKNIGSFSWVKTLNSAVYAPVHVSKLSKVDLYKWFVDSFCGCIKILLVIFYNASVSKFTPIMSNNLFISCETKHAKELCTCLAIAAFSDEKHPPRKRLKASFCHHYSKYCCLCCSQEHREWCNLCFLCFCFFPWAVDSACTLIRLVWHWELLSWLS